jgi:hypothetical protein
MESDPGAPVERDAGRAPLRWLLAGATVALFGAGLLLWARDGEAVFATYVVSALAWCF